MNGRPKDPRKSHTQSALGNSSNVNDGILRAAQNQQLVNALFASRPLSDDSFGKKYKETQSLKLYYPTDESRSNSLKPKPDNCRTLIISNLPATANENHIKELFQNAQIEEMKFEPMTDPSGKAARICLITFVDPSHVDRAIKYHNFCLIVKRGRRTQAPMPCDIGQLSIDYASQNLDLKHWRQEQSTINQMASNSKVPPFSESEVTNVLNFLRDSDKLVPSLNIITEWSRTDFSKINCRNFYSLMTMSLSTVEKVIQTNLSDLKELTKRNRQDEENRRNGIEDTLKAAQKLLDTCEKNNIQKRFYTEPQRIGIKDTFDKTKTIIFDVQKNLVGLDVIYNKKSTSNNTNYSEDIIAAFQNENDEMKENLKKLKEDHEKKEKEFSEKNKSILSESTKLVVQMSTLQSESNKLQTKINELNTALETTKKEQEKSHEVMTAKEKEVTTLKEARSTLEKYISLVSRERNKARMFDELLSTKYDESNDTTNDDDSPLIFHVKDENNPKRTLEQQSTSSSNNEGPSNKKLKLTKLSLTHQELILLPIISIFLRSLPYGASALETSKILSENNIQIDSAIVLNIFKKLPIVFKPDPLSSLSRWKLIVFDHFAK